MTTWRSAGTDNAADETCDLPDGNWAIIGPGYPDGYGWTVVDGVTGDDLASGHDTADADAAKAAVMAWTDALETESSP